MSNWKLKSADIPVPELSEFDPYRNAMMEKGYAKSRYLLAESIAISALDMLEEMKDTLTSAAWSENVAHYQDQADKISQFLNQHR